MVMRSDLSKLKEMTEKRQRSKKTREELNEKYKVQETREGTKQHNRRCKTEA